MEILLNDSYFQMGFVKGVNWHPSLAPHMVIFGNTGSGKTYCCKLILGKIALHEKKSQIYVCDFKGDIDYSFLEGQERFFRFMECQNGLQLFYDKFQQRQSGTDKSRNMLVYYFDEWASYCNSISDDKKFLEAEKRKLANVLMLGRSFSCHVILSQQRVDAQYFNTARDNFNITIGLGNLSEESKQMFFHEYKKDMKPDRGRGTGYMLENGANLTSIRVPKITNFKKLNNTILQAVKR